MDWGTIGLWVAAALVLWFAWQTYLEQQVRFLWVGTISHPQVSCRHRSLAATLIMVRDHWQMEATALRAARAARERWAVPAQDMNLAQVR